MERILQKIGFLFFTQFIYLSSFAQLDVPDNLTAVPESSSRITLEWTASTDNVDNYGIERSESETEGWLEIDVINGNRTSYQDQGLTSGITYYYRIRAITTLENSAYSNIANATTFSAPQAPTATVATDISQTSFTANWTLVAEATSYELDVSVDEFVSFIPGYEALSVTESAYNVTGLEPGTPYKYRVRAVNANGISVNSENILVTTAVPTPPPAPTATASTDISQTGFTANWSSVTEATAYELDVSGNSFASMIPGYDALTVSNTTQTVSGLAPATFYEYRVRAINADGESESSNVISVTTENVPPPPPAPTATFATNIETTSFTANWTPIDEATGYELDVSGNNFASLIPGYDALAVSSTSHNVTNLEPSTPYKYKVRAVNENGISVSSNEIEATTEDLPPPETPTGFAANAFSSNQIDLSWMDNSDEDNYILEWSADGNDPWTAFPAIDPNTLTFSHTGLAENTTYYYRLTAVNAEGPSGYATANATTLATIPVTPANLTATTASSTQINLSWDNNATNETGYIIEGGTTAGGPYTQIATTGANVTTYQNTGLSGNTTYYYIVKATNSAGASSASNEASATTPAVVTVPPAPANLTATAISSTRIDLEWDDTPNETGYIIERGTTTGGPYTEIATTGANVTTYQNTGLSGSTTYYYVVRAENSAGPSGASNEAGATTPAVVTVPPVPTNLTATAISSTRIDLEWDDTPNETGYIIERGTTSGGPYTQIATPEADATTFQNTGLSGNTTYYYVVKATNSAGTSGASNEANAKTPAVVTIPTKPSGLTATAVSTE
ncbi:MAG TPA: fibronectin type III domain-containing protein, partial [Cytophagales bacterium]|nr:fibronectin type III domain-containing protein [Cytophagales bacterium]